MVFIYELKNEQTMIHEEHPIDHDHDTGQEPYTQEKKRRKNIVYIRTLMRPISLVQTLHGQNMQKTTTPPSFRRRRTTRTRCWLFSFGPQFHLSDRQPDHDRHANTTRTSTSSLHPPHHAPSITFLPRTFTLFFDKIDDLTPYF